MADEAFQRRLERVLLGGQRSYTRLQVAELAGVSEERTRQLWRALGFAAVPNDQVVFTDADVEAVRIADGMIDAGVFDQELETAVTRALGLHLSRLAEWQADLLWSLVREHPELAADEQRLTELVETLVPQLERVQSFVWRRHLVAYAGRALAVPDEDLEARTQVVGFVDMVGYTRMTRRIDENELGDVLERFEALATEVVAEGRGRVVKMIGDEVLFVADSPAEAAEIALTLTERTSTDDELPPVRAGLASGRVLSRFGDVYGETVNLASRLTSIARPGTILVDRTLAKALTGDPAYELRSRRSASVRGYSRIRPAALRRARGQSGSSDSGPQAADLLGLAPRRGRR
ncbi:adenylate/guanylate cyclase domain-containing protein [Prauserella cavernicola]|uniref:Adenylate/guanylate cyclase domain-containing protein n=1 Tax=Prauserella cavernicola TaxID=2800127 RepID=A0A934QTF9_9PSEU|nr:adenylate/guanylate cyclase domain-containing protein [Prauserella cavernicola]MBK1786045.1 adenylate/guanylate cyclase domain-containing protein [Prauserella cavernicola]